MKKITHLILFSVGLVFLFNIGNISAQEKATFKPRFSEAVNGNVTMIANNVLSRHKSDNYNGSAGNHDFTNNVFVDIDNENTFNSSNAEFINPEPSLACLGIKKAYLYWAAADMEEDDLEDEPNWNYNQVKIKLPGEVNYQTITADEVIYRGRTEHFVNDPYVCFKDITNQVSSLNSAYGVYQVANVRAKKGGLTSHGGGNTGTSGGWQIVFIYESPVLPAKNISLFDGYGHMTKDLGELTISFTGFTTLPGNQQVNADIVIGALEGDRDLSGDKLQIQKVNNTWENLSYSNSANQVVRSANNFFNSKITKNGNNFTNRYPSSENTLGFDADVFPLSNPNNSVIGNNQQSAKIKLISDQETYGLFLIGLSVDVWKPDLAPLVLSSTPANGASVNVGSLVNMSFQIKNNGNDNVKDLVTAVDIPEEVDLIEPITSLPTGVSYNYNSTTRKLTFTSVNGITDIADQAYAINYQVKVKEQCYFLETKCSEEFQLQMQATYKGIKNTNTQTTKSSSTTINCGIGDEKPITIKINRPAEADWVTVVNSLDRKISCDDTGELEAAQLLKPTLSCDLIITKVSGDFIESNNCPTIGTYTNTWTFTDICGRKSDEYVQVITIKDTGAPIITCPIVSTSYNLDENSCTYEGTFIATAMDTCSEATITYKVNGIPINFPYNFPEGTTIVTAIAKDDCNNISEPCTFEVVVQDKTPPVITLTGAAAMTLESCATYIEEGATVTDCETGLTVVIDASAVDMSTPGTYTVTYNVSDTAGNEATEVTRAVTVQDTTEPVITLTGSNP
ncbi:DUF5011 domain-containing protein, partial [Tenacibaculum bernardetii]|uniref:DUF5011 domain-containing protein n=1 Tax=Tenacibaculum bernardetii TaxID=3021375 RepID=UPI0023AFC85B